MNKKNKKVQQLHLFFNSVSILLLHLGQVLSFKVGEFFLDSSDFGLFSFLTILLGYIGV